MVVSSTSYVTMHTIQADMRKNNYVTIEHHNFTLHTHDFSLAALIQNSVN